MKLFYIFTAVSVMVIITFLYAEKTSYRQVEVQIQEWLVPWNDSRPRDPYVAPDGNIWFVGQRSHFVAEFDPENETFRKIDLEEGTGPHTVIVDENGYPWYAGNRANHIGKVNPESGEITKYMMPEDMSASDPHTMTFDKNGNIWFTSQTANSVGLFNVEKEESIILPVSTKPARPYGIIMDTNNERPWIALFGTNKLATVDPDSMKLIEIELPDKTTRPRRLAQTSDGTLWYGDYSRGYLGSYDPNTEEFNEWPLPSGKNSRPYALTVDNQDRIWVVETGVDPNLFVGFDTKTNEFLSSTPIKSRGRTVRHMVFDAKTNSIWFGTDTNYLGQARLN